MARPIIKKIDEQKQVVFCHADYRILNPFLQQCLLAIGWETGTPEEILAVLEAAVECKEHFTTYGCKPLPMQKLIKALNKE